MVPSVFAPAASPSFHPLCNDAAHMILHGPHISIAQSFRTLRNIKVHLLIRQQAVTVVPEVFQQGLCLPGPFFFENAVAVCLQIFEQAIQIAVIQIFMYGCTGFPVLDVFPDRLVPVERIQLEYGAFILYFLDPLRPIPV